VLGADVFSYCDETSGVILAGVDLVSSSTWNASAADLSSLLRKSSAFPVIPESHDILFSAGPLTLEYIKRTNYLRSNNRYFFIPLLRSRNQNEFPIHFVADEFFKVRTANILIQKDQRCLLRTLSCQTVKHTK
jgi:hypothetical protein